ncbi:putative 3-methyl-2-oxobutanoate dehydrogenase (2-methylpropanoyl-transferring) [Helianthus annuus]|nr:putative 3-methyl-2-oxobutanoate dehydrogenase (2-methylpropanoyl-transferring) [Helianthus annuus]KAJ0924329.1 putative 3-methyl-2-oxobutanoate dehydrogenase (2-methylpropanoyl-transferring) [Helianthus annuus]
MSMLLFLTRTRTSGSNFIKRIICSNPILSPYQPTSSSSSLPSHLSGSNNRSNGTTFAFRYSYSCSSTYATFLGARGYISMKAGEQMLSEEEDADDGEYALEENKAMDFPGGKITYTTEIDFLPASSDKRVQCYRVLDKDGYPISYNMSELVSKEVALKMYKGMVTLNIMDKFFYEAQRQGRLSFYLTSFGEEAINLASAAALSSDDIVLTQYREPGILLWRGFTVQDFANQCFGNNSGHGKGRQMPIHYGSKSLNFITISSPLTTQLPQAVGMAYSLKMDKKDSCVVAFFGDGSASEGDFHAALNFAAVMDAPVVFVCRNNGWAISTPVTDQFRSDGIVIKGQAYGISSIRVDGNDALAVYNVVRSAREIAVSEQRPILIEAMTYRVSHHSTSDDSTKYRSVDEIEHWKTVHSPITRFKKWVERKGWWSDKEESELHVTAKKEVTHAIDEGEKEEMPPLRDMFTDVYDELTSNLMEQETLLRETIQKHPLDFPKDIPL